MSLIGRFWNCGSVSVRGIFSWLAWSLSHQQAPAGQFPQPDLAVDYWKQHRNNRSTHLPQSPATEGNIRQYDLIKADSNHIHSMRAVSRVNAVWETLALCNKSFTQLEIQSQKSPTSLAAILVMSWGAWNSNFTAGWGWNGLTSAHSSSARSGILRPSVWCVEYSGLNHDKFYRALTKHLMEKKIQPQGRNNFRRGHWNPPRNNHWWNKLAGDRRRSTIPKIGLHGSGEW